MAQYSTRIAALAASLVLGACAVVPPSGPTLLATPPEGKNLDRFQSEEGNCRNYASAQIGYGTPQQAANQAAVGSAVAGTALGAAAGALIGSAGGAAGAGAAVGAGTGLLVGSAVGGNNAQASSHGLQARYDQSYAQCMASAGNRVEPGYRPGYVGAPAYVYGAPYVAPYAYPAYPYYGPAYGYGPSVSFGFYGGGRPYYYGRPYGFGGWYGGRRRW
jgi:Glycine-zipper domain